MADSKLLFTRIAQRIDTEANWKSSNPVLLKGELAITYVEGGKAKFKVGDNVTPWMDLPYTYDYEEILSQISDLESDMQGVINGLGGNVYKVDALSKLNEVSNPKKGDLGIVETLIHGDKKSLTAYAYDVAANSGAGAWVALDGNYNAENVYFDEDLITTSAVGNISLSNGQATIAAQGKNLKQVFETIFVKEVKTGLQKTAPSLTLTNKTDSSAVEIGTTITPKYATTFSAGEYKYGPATGITASNYAVTNNKTDESLEDTAGTFGTYKFEDVTSYTVSATCTSSQGAIPKSNLGNPIEGQRFAEATRTATTITLCSSYKPNFYGFITDASKKLTTLDATTLTNSFIRGLTSQGSTTTPLTAVTPSAKWIQFIYAIPAGRKSGLEAQDDKTKLPCAKATKHENIEITHQGGLTSKYTVFVISNDALADANKMNLTWKA